MDARIQRPVAAVAAGKLASARSVHGAALGVADAALDKQVGYGRILGGV